MRRQRRLADGRWRRVMWYTGVFGIVSLLIFPPRHYPNTDVCDNGFVRIIFCAVASMNACQVHCYVLYGVHHSVCCFDSSKTVLTVRNTHLISPDIRKVSLWI